MDAVLYGRARCHLCEEMWEDLQPFMHDYGLKVGEIDVDTDPALRRVYGDRVPVLVIAGREICAGRLDSGRLGAMLRESMTHQNNSL